jgi:hypothetical protein
MQVVTPHLQNLEQQNAKRRQRLAKEARHNLDQRVAAAVPNYREIDRDPHWQSLHGAASCSAAVNQARDIRSMNKFFSL